MTGTIFRNLKKAEGRRRAALGSFRELTAKPATDQTERKTNLPTKSQEVSGDGRHQVTLEVPMEARWVPEVRFVENQFKR